MIKGVSMVGKHRKYIFWGLSILLYLPLELSALHLVAPTQEGCTEKKLSLEQKFNREFYVRAAALTASACYGAYAVWHFLMAPSYPMPRSPIAEKWVFTVWIKKAVISLPALVAQTICVQMCASRIMNNNADPRIFITKYICYKAHEFEIDRLLLEYSAQSSFDNQKHIDLLIEGHLQALFDKTELLMAYMAYYAEQNSQPHMVSNIKHYTSEIIHKLSVLAATCNEAQQENYREAVVACKKTSTDMLVSSIRYTISTLPLAE